MRKWSEAESGDVQVGYGVKVIYPEGTGSPGT